MRSLILAPFVGASAVGERGGTSSVLGPIYDMLEKMVKEVTNEKNDEEVQFAKFRADCESQISGFESDIDEEKKSKEELTARIAELAGDIDTLASQIEDAGTSISAKEQERANESDKAAKDKAERQATIADLAKAVNQIGRAKAVIAQADAKSSSSKDGQEAQVFLQSSKLIPDNIRSLALSLLETSQLESDMEATAAPTLGKTMVMESSSGGVLEIIEEMEDKLIEEHRKAEEGLMVAGHNYEMRLQKLKDTITNEQRNLEDMQVRKSQKEEEKMKKEEDLSISTKTLKDAKAALRDRKRSCEHQTHSFNEKQTLRAEEIQTLEQVITILTEATGSPRLLFLQISSSTSAVSGEADVDRDRVKSAKVSSFLSKRGRKLSSKILSLLAEKISTSTSANVLQMIRDMIEKLETQMQEGEEEHQACLKKLAHATAEVKKFASKLEKNIAARDKATAGAAEAEEKVASLKERLARTRNEVREAHKVRNEERKAYTHAQKEQQKAVEGITLAIQTLQDFYGKAAKATAFLQESQDPLYVGSQSWGRTGEPLAAIGSSSASGDTGHTEGMGTYGEAYKGKQDIGNQIIQFLGVAKSEAEDTINENAKNEEEAVAAFEKLVKEAEVNEADATVQLGHNEKEAKKEIVAQRAADVEAKENQRQVTQSQKILEDYKNQCPVTAGGNKNKTTRQDMIDHLTEEIASLKEAQTILTSS